MTTNTLSPLHTSTVTGTTPAAPASETIALQLRDLNKAFFGIYAVKNVSLALPTGRTLGLVGQNGAGKSTLMNIIGGVVQPDSGEMLLHGVPYAPRVPRDAGKAGIAFIHQELNLFTNLSIAENIFIDQFPQRGIFPFRTINRREMRDRTRHVLEQVALDISPETLIEQLAPGERQLVEIAKALQFDARLIIFDEPTTSLTQREHDKLFAIIRQLHDAGKTLIYISHNLGDVLEVADQIAVMRDGELVSTGARAEYATDRMIAQMVGRNLEQLYPARTAAPQSEPVLTVEGLTEPGIVRNISFTVYKGEILGVFGLMGSGRTELARILFGLDGFSEGRIMLAGKHITHTSPRSSIRQHVAFVTENRREEGLLLAASVSDNISLVSLPDYATRLTQIVRQGELGEAAQDAASTLQIKAGSLARQTAKSLSGGNQQKVVLAKWLLSQPELLLLDEPTRGIDVGAKYEIYSIINALAAAGQAIFMISSELEELMGICDRILVMSRGEVSGMFARAEFDKERILRAAFREQQAPDAANQPESEVQP